MDSIKSIILNILKILTPEQIEALKSVSAYQENFKLAAGAEFTQASSKKSLRSFQVVTEPSEAEKKSDSHLQKEKEKDNVLSFPFVELKKESTVKKEGREEYLESAFIFNERKKFKKIEGKLDVKRGLRNYLDSSQSRILQKIDKNGNFSKIKTSGVLINKKQN